MSELRVVYVLTMNGRVSFDALSPADRAQLTAAGKAILGEETLEAAYQWLEREEMALHKLQLVRGDTVEHDVWINAALDDGALLEPGQPKATGITISQGCVSDTIGSRTALCAEAEAVIGKWRLAPELSAADVDLWQG
jgi:hypothetical protein